MLHAFLGQFFLHFNSFSQFKVNFHFNEKMMDLLGIREGGYVTVLQKELVKGTFVKIQPHSKLFLEIHNPQAVLERHLRSFSAMTKGDTFVFKYNNTPFKFNVLETKPANAISIIETDINVDFAPPLDYVEEPGLPSLNFFFFF